MMAAFLQKNPRLLILILGVILVGGFSSALVIPRLEDPVLRKRVAVVSTIFPGADGHRVESFISSRLEEYLLVVPEIKQVRSNSRQGISNLIIELRDDVDDVSPVWERVSQAMDDAQIDLPQGCSKSRLEIFPLKAYAAIVGIQWQDTNTPNATLLSRIGRRLASQINGLAGTEKVDVFGDAEEELLIEVEPEVLAATGLNVGKIATEVAASFVTQPAGVIRGTDQEILLDLPLKGATTREINNINLTDARGQRLALADIATVNQVIKTPVQDVALIDSRAAFVIGAFVDQQYSLPQWTNDLERLMEKARRDYQAEITIEPLFLQQEHIAGRIALLVGNLAMGMLAVVLVVWLLMGWRSMIVVGVALPLSAGLVLLAMRALEIPLHQMSITGLIVALGLLIDNAIVVVEDIRTRLIRDGRGWNRFGETRGVEVILASVAHLRMPLLGSTLTTTLAFLPIAILSGPAGEFVGTIAISVILAISASFVLSMTVIPALFVLLQPNSVGDLSVQQEQRPSRLKALYRRSLECAYRFPMFAIAVCVVLPLLGFLAAIGLPEQFFPASDRRQIQIEVELSARSTVEKTRQAILAMEPVVLTDAGVERVSWFAGRSAPTFYYNVVPRRRGTPFYAQAIVDLRYGYEAEQVVSRLQTQLDRSFPEARTIVRQLQQGPPFDAPVEVQIQGPDLEVLRELGGRLRLLMTRLPDVIHTRSDLEDTVAKLALEVDARSASQAGLNRQSIAGQLYQNLEGAAAGTIYSGGQEIPVRVKMASSGSVSTDFQELEAIEIRGTAVMRGNRGQKAGLAAPGPPRPSKTVLGAVTNVVLDGDVGAIIRIDGQRTNEIKAYIKPGVLPSKVVNEFKQRLKASEFVLPAEYQLTYGGEAAQRSHAVNQLIANAPLLFALMVLTLVGALNSFRQTLIVVIVGSLSVGLVGLALSVFDYPLGFMAIVGTMGLVGVAINDSIVVLAAISEDREKISQRNAGLDQQPTEELTWIVSSVSRCSRHIFATTLTTIAGFLPLVLSGGKFWPPLAITIAAGVAGATLMALYLAPALYALICNRRWQ